MDVEYVDDGELAAIEAAMAAAERRGSGAACSVGAPGGVPQPQQLWGGPAPAAPPPQQGAWQAPHGGQAPQWQAPPFGGGGGGGNYYAAPATRPATAPPPPPQQQQPQPPPQLQHGQQQLPWAPPRAGPPGAGAVCERAEAKHAPPRPPPPPQPACRVDLRLLPDTRVAFNAFPAQHDGPLADALRAAPGAVAAHDSPGWLVPATAVGALVASLRSLGARVEPLPPTAAAALEFAAASLVGDHEADATWQRVPASLRRTMFPFQTEGVKYAIRRAGRALIGDEMGLGKTVQAVALMAAYRTDWPALVLCPASLRDAWAAALVTWLPEALRPPTGVRVLASGRDVAGAVSGLTRRDILVVPYSLVAKASEALLAARFGVVVADESHCLKDGKAQRTRGAAPLLRAARRALCLTGTPALSRPVELFAQLNALQPRVFASFNDYAARFCAGGRFGVAQGCSNAAELHAAMAACLLVRRLKRDVLTQLPPKVRSRVALPVPPSRALVKLRAELAAAQAAAQGGDETARAEERRLMTALFTESAAHKAPACADYLSTLVDGAAADAKLIFFAHHAAMLDTVAQRMSSDRVAFIRIDGRTPVGERAVLVERFQSDDSVRLALLSIKAAGVGLTLTAASTVVFGELSWCPGDVVQAEDRAHRIGQQNSVAVHILHAPGCVDEFMWNAIQHKLDKLGHVLDGGADSMHVAAHLQLDGAGGVCEEGGGGGASQGKQAGIRGFFAPRQPLAARNEGGDGCVAAAAAAAAPPPLCDDTWAEDEAGGGGHVAAAPAEAGGEGGANKRPREGAADEDDWGGGW